MIILGGKDVDRLKRIFWAIMKRIDQERGVEPAHLVGCGCTECDRICMFMGEVEELGKD